MTNLNIAFPSRREAYNLWLVALESGQFVQTRGKLKKDSRTNGPSFCCLGVVCDINAEIGGPKWKNTRYLSHVLELPRDLQQYLAITNAEQEKLVSLNDVERKSFYDVADYIRDKIMPKALARPDNYRIRRSNRWS